LTSQRPAGAAAEDLASSGEIRDGSDSKGAREGNISAPRPRPGSGIKITNQAASQKPASLPPQAPAQKPGQFRQSRSGGSYGGGSYGSGPYDGQRRPKGELLPVAKILAAVLKKQGIEDEIKKYEFVTRWAEIVGPEVAKRTKPDCIKKGTLIVSVVSSTWAQELTLHKTSVLSRLQRVVGSDLVQDLKFCVGDIGR
jgi:hypothetical protein